MTVEYFRRPRLPRKGASHDEHLAFVEAERAQANRGRMVPPGWTWDDWRAQLTVLRWIAEHDRLVNLAEDGPFFREAQTRYEKYLRSPEWRAKRKELFATRGQMCERCGSPHRLEVHHLTYERFGAERLDDLEVLCSRCHRKRHGKAAERGGSKRQGTTRQWGTREVETAPQRTVSVEEYMARRGRAQDDSRQSAHQGGAANERAALSLARK